MITRWHKAAFPDDQFVVVCRADKIGRRKGSYVLATRQVFATAEEAEGYARTCAPSREPLVVAGRFATLRFPGGKS